MAKSNNGGGRSKNTLTSAQQDEIRRAAKGRRNAAARARAHGSKADNGSRGTGDLFGNIKNDRRTDLLNQMSNERRKQAEAARKVLAHMGDTAPLHAEGSYTARMADNAYKAALDMVKAFENTDPVFAEQGTRIMHRSLDIVTEEYREELTAYAGSQFATVVIKEVRNALYGVKQRPVRTLTAA